MCDKWKDRSSCVREIHICELNSKGNEIELLLAMIMHVETKEIK